MLDEKTGNYYRHTIQAGETMEGLVAQEMEKEKMFPWPKDRKKTKSTTISPGKTRPPKSGGGSPGQAKSLEEQELKRSARVEVGRFWSKLLLPVLRAGLRGEFPKTETWDAAEFWKAQRALSGTVEPGSGSPGRETSAKEALSTLGEGPFDRGTGEVHASRKQGTGEDTAGDTVEESEWEAGRRNWPISTRFI